MNGNILNAGLDLSSGGLVNASLSSVTVPACPANSTPEGASCRCVPNYAPNATQDACVAMSVPEGEPKACPGCSVKNPGYGKPIFPLTGAERYEGGVELGVAGTKLSLVYDSLPNVPVTTAGNEVDVLYGTLGGLWSTNVHKKLLLGPGLRGARAVRGAGRSVAFVGDGSGNFSAEADVNDRLVSIGGGYRYTDAASGAQETYDTQGLLSRIDRADGSSAVYTYSTGAGPAAPAAGYLLSIADPFGRQLQFEYDASGRINKITGPSAATITPGYSGANLSQITWPDSQVRKFHYENSNFVWALTGITDENNARHATIGYDSAGRANTSELAGGVDHYAVTYSQPPSVVVTDTYDTTNNLVNRSRGWQPPVAPVVTLPKGDTLTLAIASAAALPAVNGRSQPAGAGSAASSSAIVYDANGNVASEDDFNGKRVCSGYDLSRNLETVRVEGLSNTQSCAAVTTANATLPAGSRKTSTEWHPDWRLSKRVAEPGRLTTSVYNGQPDPFNANATASCAPSTALLPDGKPIAVLCRQVEQATTDADGSQGFAASLQAGVASREQKWTYNQYGQVLTHDGPRTDVNDVTTYAYYSDTAFTGADPNAVGHTIGDLQTVTDATGKVTQYTQYDKHGNVLEKVDPNGVVTTYTYDLRQRLLSVSVGGQTTSYTYDPVGQLTKVTQPDASWVGYEYDDAHRRKAALDSLGNRIEYTLDNAGNVTAQAVRDPGGVLRRTLARSIDALGRVQQSTGRQ